MTTQVKPTYRDIEAALIDVVKAGILYKKPKDGKLMQGYKERVTKLCQAEDLDKYVVALAQSILPNEAKYRQLVDDYKSWYKREPKLQAAVLKLNRLYYELAKDYFLTDEQIKEEAEDFLNS